MIGEQNLKLVWKGPYERHDAKNRSAGHDHNLTHFILLKNKKMKYESVPTLNSIRNLLYVVPSKRVTLFCSISSDNKKW